MKTIKWIDILKGIGIVTVVIGHIWGGTLSRMIYVFHMPLFFFISGYLSKATVDYKSYHAKKTKSLFVPYVVYLIIIYLVFYGIPELTIKEVAKYFARPIVGGRYLAGSLGVFWFVTCLYLTQQVMNFFITKYEHKRVKFIMFVFLILSYINSSLFPRFWLPWNFNVVLAAAPIYYIGHYFKNENVRLNNMYMLLGFLVVTVFTFFYPANVYDMKNANYGLPLITLISSLVLILGLKIISEYFSKIKIIEKPISELGKASMVIMYLHQPIQIIVSRYLTEDRALRIFLATLIPYLLYLLFKKFKYTDALLLGNYHKFDIEQVLKITNNEKHGGGKCKI